MNLFITSSLHIAKNLKQKTGVQNSCYRFKIISHFRAHVKKKHLPPHPNLARMYGYFVDRVPLLDAAHCMYPMALPPRLNAGGFGRNSTLFIVMKKCVSYCKPINFSDGFIFAHETNSLN